MRGAWARARSLWAGVRRPERLEREMDEEMRFHLAMEAERLQRDLGIEPAEARRRAAIAFGSAERFKEEGRDARGVSRLSGMSLDLRLGVRMMARSPGITAIGGFALAVAIALCAIGFELVGEVLEPALPLDEGERVVAVQVATDKPGNPERRVLHDFVAWRGELRTVEQLGAFRTVRRNLVTGLGAPEPVEVAEISAAAFAVARTPPALGRHLVPDDERADAAPVLVIGHGVWRDRFAADRAVVGRTVHLGGEPVQIVGVMPEGFRFPIAHAYWIPLRADTVAFARLDGPALHLFGRVATGATLAGAQAELATLGRRTAAALPTTHTRLRPRVLPFPRDHLEMLDYPPAARALRLLQLLMGALLAVVAANLAILTYARTVARLGEIAVRTALGASRRRILAQLFAESLALALAGAAVGLALAQGTLRWIFHQFAAIDDIPFWLGFQLSPSTAAYALALALVAAAITGVLPGWKATGRRLQVSLREMGGGARLGRVWSALVVGQVAIAVTVLPLAVYAVHGVLRIDRVDLGFPAERYLVGGITLEPAVGPARSGEGSDRGAAFPPRQAELMRRLASEPGVEAVAFSSATPGVDGADLAVEVEGVLPVENEAPPRAAAIRVGEGLFAAYDAELLAGRPISAGDVGGRAAVVNRTFVHRLLGGRTALGRRFRYAAPPTAGDDAPAPGPWYEIVGVVEDFPAVPLGIASAGGTANAYHPAGPADPSAPILTVRYRGELPAGAAGRVREVAAEVDPALQLPVRPLSELYGSLRSASRTVAWALAAITGAVLLLSAAGIYALMSFAVARRTREIGIRTALGAQPRRILASIFGRVAGQLAAGVLLGMLLSGAIFVALDFGAALAAGLLLAVAAIMLLVGLVAAVGPARRGLRIQPMEAIRGL